MQVGDIVEYVGKSRIAITREMLGAIGVVTEIEEKYHIHVNWISTPTASGILTASPWLLENLEVLGHVNE